MNCCNNPVSRSLYLFKQRLDPQQYFLCILLFFMIPLLFAQATPPDQPDFEKQTIPDFYPDLEKMYAQMDSLAQQYPDLLQKVQIGISSTKAQPIFAMKLSDQVEKTEDEPAILLSGLHHAREPVGALFCLHFIQEMSSNYQKVDAVHKLVDNFTIWIVPVVNPDGYEYMFEHGRTFPWWRKNMRNYYARQIKKGLGVDLSRNYNYNWIHGGGDTPESWYYRGDSPASEAEVQAMQQLALRENVIAGATFHSYGELVLFPWGNYYSSPDQELMFTLATGIAQFMQKEHYFDTYDIGMLDGLAGQSSNWMHGRLRAADFTIELGTEYFPDQETVNKVLHQTMKSIMFFLDKVLQTGLRGHVVDYHTRKPVSAQILVDGFEAKYMRERVSEKRFGRFERLLPPGKYNLTILAEGYSPQIMPEIEIQKDKVTELTVFLMHDDSTRVELTH